MGNYNYKKDIIVSPKDKVKIKIGEYISVVFEKDKNEYFGPETLKEGDCFWTIRMDKDTYFDTLRQEDAIIISNQIKIMSMLTDMVRE